MSNQSLVDDAIDDIIAIVSKEAKNDPVMDGLHYIIEGDRGNYDTRVMMNMGKLVVSLYEFFFEDYHVGKSEDYCWEEALHEVIRGSAANAARKDQRTLNELTDKEYDQVLDDCDRFKQIDMELQRWLRNGNSGGRRTARRSSDRDYGRSARRGIHNDNRSNNRRDRRSSSNRNGSMFEDRSARVDSSASSTDATSARARAITQNAPEPVRQQTRREEPVRHLDSVAKHTTKYFSSLSEIRMIPKRPGNEEPPYYDPVTQRLRVSLDKDGFVKYEVLEVNEMHPEDHQTVIATMLYEFRKDEYKPSLNKEIHYQVDGIAIEASMVENERVDEIMKEMVEAGTIKKESKFMDLSEELRRQILTESSARLIKARRMADAERQARRIEEGKNANPDTLMDISVIKHSGDKMNLSQVISLLLNSQGDQLNKDTYRNRGYLAEFHQLSVLTRAESPDEQRVLSNLLAGFKIKGATIQKLHASLSQKDIPLAVYTKLNRKCTGLMNIGLHHILGKVNLHVEDFHQELNELSEYLVSEISNGNITNEQLNELNAFVSNQAALIVQPDLGSLKTDYGYIEDEITMDSMRAHCIFELNAGKVIYLPMMCNELGLSPTIGSLTVIDPSSGGVVCNLTRAQMNGLRAGDYLCTHDGLAYYVLHVGSKIILRTQQVN